jgi:two-component system LytT family sensor kinase
MTGKISEMENPKDRHGLRRMVLFVLGILGLWLLLGVFLGIQIYLNNPEMSRRSLGAAVDLSLRRYLPYALLTFPILALCRRFPFTSDRWVAPLMAHGAGVVAFTVLYAPLRFLAGPPVNRETLAPVPLSFETVKILIRSNLFEQFWMYTSIVTAALAIQYYRQSRQRELREMELKRQMAEHELHVLKLQLHPHFLFNTLNGISTLMARDAKTAREMLVRLSELLRIALSHSADHEVSLREEIEFVKAYIELEQMRFGERLRARLDVDPATLDARVPNMLIQPLVENAIQYGIAQIRSGGVLDLVTDRNDGQLRIRIVNDGPLEALEPHPARGTGIGLSNTRARLWQLYGDAYRLHMVGRPGGGTEVRLEIPFRTSGAEAAEPT